MIHAKLTKQILNIIRPREGGNKLVERNPWRVERLEPEEEEIDGRSKIRNIIKKINRNLQERRLE